MTGVGGQRAELGSCMTGVGGQRAELGSSGMIRSLVLRAFLPIMGPPQCASCDAVLLLRDPVLKRDRWQSLRRDYGEF